MIENTTKDKSRFFLNDKHSAYLIFAAFVLIMMNAIIPETQILGVVAIVILGIISIETHTRRIEVSELNDKVKKLEKELRTRNV